MRVLFVAHQYAYGNPRRGISYEWAEMLPALQKLADNVICYDMSREEQKLGTERANAALVQLALDSRPDVLFAVPFTDEVYPSTFSFISFKLRVPSVAWFCDDQWRWPSFSRFYGRAFWLAVTTYAPATKWYLAAGQPNVLVSQWACNPVDRPRRLAGYDVSFVGTAHGSRRRVVRGLASRGVSVACFGTGWQSGPWPGSPTEVYERSKINLNFAGSVRSLRRFGRRIKQIKARVFEVPGAGGFLLTEYVEGLEEFFRLTEEIETFHCLEEAADKCRFYLKNDAVRERIAHAGWERACHDHSYEKRFSEIFRRLAHVNPEAVDQWPSYGEGVSRGRRFLAQVARWALLPPSSVVFGRARGKRFARRLVFEASWRVFGGETYEANGLPRLGFPDVV